MGTTFRLVGGSNIIEPIQVDQPLFIHNPNSTIPGLVVRDIQE